MSTWLISDTHFGHDKLEKWGKRAAGWQEKIWDGLSQVPKGHTLIHLGDICMGQDAHVHERLFADFGVLKGVRSVLVRGNHDTKSNAWYAAHGWDSVSDDLERSFHGQSVYFSHRPAPRRADVAWNIHGHTHGDTHRSVEHRDFYDAAYHIDVSPELVGNTPILLDALIAGRC
jgi:calcineurin-like phosphoesterase family protein